MVSRTRASSGPEAGDVFSAGRMGKVGSVLVPKIVSSCSLIPGASGTVQYFFAGFQRRPGIVLIFAIPASEYGKRTARRPSAAG